MVKEKNPALYMLHLSLQAHSLSSLSTSVSRSLAHMDFFKWLALWLWSNLANKRQGRRQEERGLGYLSLKTLSARA